MLFRSDFRQLVWDQGLFDDGMWDDHSGVRPNPAWPQISYGQIHSSLVAENATVASAHTDAIAILAQLTNHFMWDHSVWDEDRDVLNYDGMLTDQEGISGQYTGQTWAAITWQPTAWGNVNVVATSTVTTQTA